MTRIIHFAILMLFASCFAQSQSGTAQQSAPATGLVQLAAPYTISTAPHFAVLVEFPRSDSIRRIALGDSNYFLAEADKDDPHYAIVKQIRASSGSKANPPIETNMLVYMASGRVVNIMLKAGKLADTAYSVDYPVPNVQPATPPNDPPPVPESVKRETARAELADKMLADVKQEPKKDGGIAAGGLMLRFYRTDRVGDLALASFDVENTTSNVIDLGSLTTGDEEF